MRLTHRFERLAAEAMGAPIEGWDFSWLEGRATEERPPWGYERLLADRLSDASSLCDVDTGGGEVLAEALRSADRRPGARGDRGVAPERKESERTAGVGESQCRPCCELDGPIRRRHLRPRRKPPSYRLRLGRNRPRHHSRRRLLCPARGGRLQPRAVRLLVGAVPAGGGPEPRKGGRGGRSGGTRGERSPYSPLSCGILRHRSSRLLPAARRLDGPRLQRRELSIATHRPRRIHRPARTFVSHSRDTSSKRAGLCRRDNNAGSDAPQSGPEPELPFATVWQPSASHDASPRFTDSPVAAAPRPLGLTACTD